MNHNLRDFLDLCYKREKKKWDNCIVIDGKERAGKSTLAKAMAYYYASISGKEFSVDNIFFNPEKMMEFAVKTRGQILVWDEAAFGGQAVHWQNKLQQQINTMMMVAGKYCHFYIFIIPSFFRLNRYLALDRSCALIHVYSPDLLARGNFLCLNELQKTWVYNNNRKSESYGKNFSFNGSFTLKNTQDIVDDVAYEAKKDKAIKDMVVVEKDKHKEKMEKAQIALINELGVKKAASLLGIGQTTAYTLKKKYSSIGNVDNPHFRKPIIRLNPQDSIKT